MFFGCLCLIRMLFNFGVMQITCLAGMLSKCGVTEIMCLSMTFCKLGVTEITVRLGGLAVALDDGNFR